MSTTRMLYEERLSLLSEKSSFSYKDIPLKDKETLLTIFPSKENFVYLPPLYGCQLHKEKAFWKWSEIAKPQSLKDLSRIECLLEGSFSSQKVLSEFAKEYGFPMVLTSREEFLSFLKDEVGMEGKEGELLLIDLPNLHEWEEILLESAGILDTFLLQIRNIRYLPSVKDGERIAHWVYSLAYYKTHYPEVFWSSIPKETGSFVGPFFSIDGKIVAYNEKVDSFDVKLRTFDSVMSHFVFFDTLGIDDDYGHYPRGRVLYDNLNKIYKIFIDRDLNKPIFKDKIIQAFHLEGKKNHFLFDSHYRHDFL